MILKSLTLSKQEFQHGTGWEIKPEGACKGGVCIPLEPSPNDSVNVEQTAAAMGLPLVHEPDHGIWSLGPESIGNRALVSARSAKLDLPDLDGKLFSLDSLLGKKVLIYAWAPY